MKIHPTAVIESGANVGSDVEVGPYAYIGPHVIVGDGCSIGHGCHLEGRLTLGQSNILHPYVALGTPPQDLRWQGQETELIVGDGNVFREYVTVNPGTVRGGGLTRIGNRNYLMACSHVGHDSIVEDETILVNSVMLGGHCCVEEGAKLMGGVGVNPFVTVGKHAYVGGLSRIVQDVPPFMIVEGHPAKVRGINEVGLQRAHYDEEVIEELRNTYKLIYRTKKLNRSHIYDEIESNPGAHPETIYLLQFLRRAQKGPHGRWREGFRGGRAPDRSEDES